MVQCILRSVICGTQRKAVIFDFSIWNWPLSLWAEHVFFGSSFRAIGILNRSGQSRISLVIWKRRRLWLRRRHSRRCFGRRRCPARHRRATVAVLDMRRTLLNQLGSWEVRRFNQLSSTDFNYLEWLRRFFTPGQQWITPEDRLWFKRQSSHEANQTNNQFKGLKGPFWLGIQKLVTSKTAFVQRLTQTGVLLIIWVDPYCHEVRLMWSMVFDPGLKLPNLRTFAPIATAHL